MEHSRDQVMHSAKDRLEDCIRQLDSLLAVVRDFNTAQPGERPIVADDCPWLIEIVQRREMLATIMTIIDRSQYGQPLDAA